MNKQKNTPKGVYVGKRPKYRTRTAYPKHLTVEPLENCKVFDKITKAICVTIRDTLSR